MSQSATKRPKNSPAQTLALVTLGANKLEPHGKAICPRGGGRAQQKGGVRGQCLRSDLTTNWLAGHLSIKPGSIVQSSPSVAYAATNGTPQTYSNCGPPMKESAPSGRAFQDDDSSRGCGTRVPPREELAVRHDHRSPQRRAAFGWRGRVRRAEGCPTSMTKRCSRPSSASWSAAAPGRALPPRFEAVEVHGAPPVPDLVACGCLGPAAPERARTA